MTNPREMINGALVEMSDADYAAFQAMQAAAVAATAQQQLLSSAQTALDKSDTTILRIQEAISLGLTTPTTADVVAWVEYRKALRVIISTKTGTIPTQPAYPANT